MTATIGLMLLFVADYIAIIVWLMGTADIPHHTIRFSMRGLFVAVIETFGSFYFDSSTATFAIFALVIAVLLVRPKGLLGHG